MFAVNDLNRTVICQAQMQNYKAQREEYVQVGTGKNINEVRPNKKNEWKYFKTAN